MAELNALLKRLDNWLKQHRPDYANLLLPGATSAELTSLENALAITLPDELRTMLTWHNGQNTEGPGGFEQDWQLMSTKQIAEDKTTLLDAEAKRTGWRVKWIPFLSDGYGDHMCLDTSQTPPPVRAFWAGNAEHEVIAKSLTEWLVQFVTAVEAGKYVEEPERGTFLRR